MVSQVVSPIRFSESSLRFDRAPPLLGQHTGDILTELGLDEAAQNDLAAAVRLTEVRPDGIGDASVPPALPTEDEACSFPTVMAKANIDAPSNGNGGNHEIHTDSGSSAVTTDISPMIHN
jgi:hypothetical protein